MGKLRRFSKTAEPHVDDVEQSPGRGVRDVVRDVTVSLSGREFRQRFGEGRTIVFNPVGLIAVGRLHHLQHFGESRSTELRHRGKVGAAPERFSVGCQEHGERPPPLLAEQLQGRLVDGVDVRPFLPVDLDVDEEIIHHAGNRFVLEALMGHDVAPVAGGVADRKQDRPVVFPGMLQDILAPRLPVDGVVPVLMEIGTGFPVEVVAQEIQDHVAFTGSGTLP